MSNQYFNAKIIKIQRYRYSYVVRHKENPPHGQDHLVFHAHKPTLKTRRACLLTTTNE